MGYLHVYRERQRADSWAVVARALCRAMEGVWVKGEQGEAVMMDATRTNMIPHDVNEFLWLAGVSSLNTITMNKYDDDVCYFISMKKLILKRKNPNPSFPSSVRWHLWLPCLVSRLLPERKRERKTCSRTYNGPQK